MGLEEPHVVPLQTPQNWLTGHQITTRLPLHSMQISKSAVAMGRHWLEDVSYEQMCDDAPDLLRWSENSRKLVGSHIPMIHVWGLVELCGVFDKRLQGVCVVLGSLVSIPPNQYQGLCNGRHLHTPHLQGCIFFLFSGFAFELVWRNYCKCLHACIAYGHYWIFCGVRYKYKANLVKLAIYDGDLWGCDNWSWVIVLKWWWELSDQAYVAAVASVHMQTWRIERLLNVGDLMGVMVEEGAWRALSYCIPWSCASLMLWGWCPLQTVSHDYAER